MTDDKSTEDNTQKIYPSQTAHPLDRHGHRRRFWWHGHRRHRLEHGGLSPSGAEAVTSSAGSRSGRSTDMLDEVEATDDQRGRKCTQIVKAADRRPAVRPASLKREIRQDA